MSINNRIQEITKYARGDLIQVFLSLKYFSDGSYLFFHVFRNNKWQRECCERQERWECSANWNSEQFKMRLSSQLTCNCIISLFSNFSYRYMEKEMKIPALKSTWILSLSSPDPQMEKVENTFSMVKLKHGKKEQLFLKRWLSFPSSHLQCTLGREVRRFSF